MQFIRDNWQMIVVASAIVAGWATFQAELTNLRAQVLRLETEVNFTKSMYYSLDNKITELQVEVRNLNKNIDIILVEIRRK